MNDKRTRCLSQPRNVEDFAVVTDLNVRGRLTDVITDPQIVFFTWLCYLAFACYPNIGEVRYEDHVASLFSGEQVLSKGIYMVGAMSADTIITV
jgi:hypothetical protein